MPRGKEVHRVLLRGLIMYRKWIEKYEGDLFRIEEVYRDIYNHDFEIYINNKYMGNYAPENKSDYNEFLENIETKGIEAIFDLYDDGCGNEISFEENSYFRRFWKKFYSQTIKRYVIKYNTVMFELKDKDRIKPGCTVGKLSINNDYGKIYSEIEDSGYFGLKFALDEIKNRKSSIKSFSGSKYSQPYFLVTEYWIEESEYNKRNEWIKSGGIVKIAEYNRGIER